MSKTPKSRSIAATPEGLVKVSQRMAELEKPGEPENKGWTQQNLADKSGASIDTVKRFLKGTPIDKKFIFWIAEALNLDITEIVDPKHLNPPTPTTTPTEINWCDICNQVLETQHLRRQATAQQYELNIYVPLGLMERPKTPNPRIYATGEDSPPQKEPELQIVQTYKDNAFFLKVIAENHTEKRKHIAIIGEPGAGKTTLLGELADRLCRGGFVDNPCHPQTAEINPPFPSDTPHQTQTTKGGFLTNTSCHPQTSGINPPLHSHTPHQTQTNSIKKPCRGGFVDNPCHPQTAEINPPFPSDTPHQTQTTKGGFLTDSSYHPQKSGINPPLHSHTPHQTQTDAINISEGGFLTDTSCHPQKSGINPPLHSPNENFPICIRLADLRDSTIADYLLNNWLSKALQFIDFDAENVTPEIRKEFKQLFAAGKVWLLLDGVDEMAATSPIEALARIREQLTDWVGKARVVLTCRLNVWDAAISNTLTDFDTYKTLEFEPDDVDEFIRQWFEEASQDEKRRNCRHETFWREQGKRLTRQLKSPGKEQIKELVRNPLRLSMLCQSWCVPQQELPETKAALYEQFTTYFFEWKQEEFEKKQRVLNKTDKKQIQQALAKLALAAMETVNRFRIEQEFAIEQMEEEWFNLADELGWLVLVDRDTRTKKPVYAFFHPTFQEYFAACAIGDWHFFLNHVPQNPKQGIYRIFEKQWKEVILLWLGRENVERKHKEHFIKALVEFEDGCGNKKFYSYRAYFLAAAGIAEFQDCSLAAEVVGKIVEWSVVWSDLVREAAKAALLETDRTKAADSLVKLIEYSQRSSQDEISLCHAAESLGRIEKSNLIAISTLLEVLQKTTTYSYPIDSLNEQATWQAIYSLGEIGTSTSVVTNALSSLAKNSVSLNIRTAAVNALNKISKNSPTSIEELVEYLVRLTRLYRHERTVATEAAYHLCILKKSSLIDNEALGYLMFFCLRRDYFGIAAEFARNIPDLYKPIVIDNLLQLIGECQYQDICCEAAYCLWLIDNYSPSAIDCLVEVIQNYKDKLHCVKAAEILGFIDKRNDLASNTLLQIIQSSEDATVRFQAMKGLTQMGKSAWIPFNDIVLAIEELPNTLFAYEEDIFITMLAEDTMPSIITALRHYLRDYKTDYRLIKNENYKLYKFYSQYKVIYHVIWQCAQNMSYSDFFQPWHIQPTFITAIKSFFFRFLIRNIS